MWNDSKNKKLSELWFYFEIDLQMLNALWKKMFCKWLLSTCITNLLMKPNFIKQKQNFHFFLPIVCYSHLRMIFCVQEYLAVQCNTFFNVLWTHCTVYNSVGTFPITLSAGDWQTYGLIWHHVHEIGLLFKISMKGRSNTVSALRLMCV